MHPAEDKDLALMLLNGLRSHQSLIIHHRRFQAIGHPRRHDDAPTISEQFTDIFHPRQGAQGRPIHGEIDQLIALNIQGDTLPADQRNITEASLHNALVAGVITGKNHIARIGIDQATVDDPDPVRRCIHRALKYKAPGHEILIVNIQRGRYQTLYINPALRAEDNALRIDQKHLPVGLYLPQNLAGILPQNAI